MDSPWYSSPSAPIRSLAVYGRNQSEGISADTPEEPKKQSVYGVIIHSFFVIPFLIAVFCVLLFAAFRILTMEDKTAYDAKASELAKSFVENFTKYEDQANEEILAAAPKVAINA